jgi:hypothetical protein
MEGEGRALAEGGEGRRREGEREKRVGYGLCWRDRKASEAEEVDVGSR